MLANKLLKHLEALIRQQEEKILLTFKYWFHRYLLKDDDESKQKNLKKPPQLKFELEELDDNYNETYNTKDRI